MADLLEKLWPAFVSEFTEQLDSGELLLVKNSAVENIDVNHLFRNFHTIKGNCSMMGFTSMETLAHKSEDILAAVRSESVAMSESVVDVLLESISALKKQFKLACDTRKNPPQDDALIKKLANFLISADSTSSAKVDVEDRHQYIDVLSGVAKASVPALILGLDAKAKSDKVETAAKMLSDKSAESGFPALSRSLTHYIAVFKSDFTDKSEQLLIITAEVFDDIEFICAEFNADLGLDLASTLCRGKLSADFSTRLSQLQTLLQQLFDGKTDEWQVEQFLQLVNHCTLLSCYCSLFRYTELNANWRYIRQLVIEVSRGYILFGSAIVEDILLIVELAQSAEASPEFQQRCRESLTQLQETTAKHNNERDEIVQMKQLIVDKSSLCIDSLIDLKIDILNVINDSIDKGLLAIEIDIDFIDEEISEKVLTTTCNLGQLTHSRTMFHDWSNGVAQRTSFAFLILTEKLVEDVERILNIIDQGRNCFTILGFADESEAVEADTSVALEQAVDQKEIDATDELMSETAMSMNSLKVDGSAIDQLISDVGETVTHQNRMEHLLSQTQFSLHLQQLKSEILVSEKSEQSAMLALLQRVEDSYGQMQAVNENLHTSLNRIQSGVLDLRVVPIAYAFNRFHKYVRTIAQKLEKKIDFKVVGEQVRIDKGMIDVLSEPLAHMIRNSIDHGIESPEIRKASGKESVGIIELKAEQQSSMVVITVRDDGAGLDKDKILKKSIQNGLLHAGVDYSDDFVFQQIFEAGLSTTDTLTATSGRGVGMDVVRSQVQAAGGTVNIQSTLGQGSCIELRLPLSAAIQSVILIEHNNQVMALPERFVSEIITVKKSDINLMQEQSVMVLRDNVIPLFDLEMMLSSHSDTKDRGFASDKYDDELEVVILANDVHCAGLVVKATAGRAEVLIRDVHESLRYMPAVSAAAILGDGQVVIILDCDGLFDMALNNVQDVLGRSAKQTT